MQKRIDRIVGVGLYTVSEAADILHVSDSKLRRWVDGYYRYAKETPRRHHPQIVQPQVERIDGHRLLTFVNLMELHLVKLFRDANVRMATIRKAAAMAGRLFATDHPFAIKRFDTDGKDIFVTLSASDQSSSVVQDAVTAQRVFENMVRPFFLKIDEQHDEIKRFWPLGHEKRVVIDPLRSLGQPIDAPSGVPTAVLRDAVEAEGNLEAVAAQYEVPLEAVVQAIEFERGAAA